MVFGTLWFSYGFPMVVLWFSYGVPGQAGNVWAVRSIARLDGRNSSALPPLGDLTVTREWVAMQLSQITELLQVSEPNIYSVYIIDYNSI